MTFKSRLDRLEKAFGPGRGCPGPGDFGWRPYYVDPTRPTDEDLELRTYRSEAEVPVCGRCGRPHGTLVIETVVSTREEVAALEAQGRT